VRTDCRICHGVKLEVILKLAPTPIGDEFLLEPRHQPLHPIDLYQCQDCGLAQLLYEIPPEEIYKDYLYLTGSSKGLDEHFAQYARQVTTVCGLKKDDLVVDIGSNDGTLLRHFKALGMTVCGFEPCKEIALRAEGNGIPTVASYFPPKPLWFASRAKLIAANNVVANLNDLDAFMEGIVALLAEDGTFVFESFYLGDVVRNMVFDFIYHEHLSAFSVKPVKHLLKRHGLHLYKIEHLPTKGGSIRYYCNRYYAGKSQAEIPDDDETLYRKQTYAEFSARINFQKEKTLAFLRWAKAQGKSIAGFGASISATTLIYHFDLGEFIDYLVDDNLVKVGRYSPGLHLKVHHPSHLYKDWPDYVLCLAWRFAGEFRNIHPAFPLIVPLPKFRCIRS